MVAPCPCNLPILWSAAPATLSAAVLRAFAAWAAFSQLGAYQAAVSWIRPIGCESYVINGRCRCDASLTALMAKMMCDSVCEGSESAATDVSALKNDVMSVRRPSTLLRPQEARGGSAKHCVRDCVDAVGGEPSRLPSALSAHLFITARHRIQEDILRSSRRRRTVRPAAAAAARSAAPPPAAAAAPSAPALPGPAPPGPAPAAPPVRSASQAATGRGLSGNTQHGRSASESAVNL